MNPIFKLCAILKIMFDDVIAYPDAFEIKSSIKIGQLEVNVIKELLHYYRFELYNDNIPYDEYRKVYIIRFHHINRPPYDD